MDVQPRTHPVVGYMNMASANTASTNLSTTAVSTEQQHPKNYAGFNSMTLEGRIFNAELVTRDGQEFLSVSVIQNLQDDDAGCEFTFTNSNGLMSLFKKGYLPTGRRVYVVGHVKERDEHDNRYEMSEKHGA